MGKRGPKPQPTALRVLRGNPSKRPINQHEPRIPPAAPKCPQWLSKEAKREFRRLAKVLDEVGMLTAVDGLALAALCEEWATYVWAQKQLAQHGHTYEYTNKFGATNVSPRPEVAIARNAFLAVKAMCAEFGLTPSSRGRIELPDAGPGSGDSYEEFLNRGPASKRG